MITGNPSFDNIFKFKKEFNKEKICSKLGLDSKKKVILIANGRFAGDSAGYTIENEEKLIKNAIKSLKTLKNIQKVIKLHPAYQEKYEKIISNIAEEEKVDLIIFKDSLWDLIMISDLFITFSSTTGLEAMLFGKTVITYGLDNTKNDLKQYISNVAAIGVCNQDELGITIKAILDSDKIEKKLSEKREKLIYDSLYLQDGRASERISNLIINELNK